MTVSGAATTAMPGGLWSALNDQLSFSNYVPRPVAADEVEERAFVNRAGETSYILKHRTRKTYLSLPADAYAIWKMMDGETPIGRIAFRYFLAHKRLVTGLLRGLVDELRAKGFLVDRPTSVFTGLALRRSQRTMRYWLLRLLGAVISYDLIQFRNGDAFIGAVYRAGGWLLFRWPAVLVMLAVVVGGFVAWATTLAQGSHSLVKTGDSYLLGFVTLILLDALATSLHELGHGLAVKHKGREVIAVGLLIYYGAPCAYVNTTDMWMADRRSRIIASWAGPFVTLILAGLAGLTAYWSPEGSLLGDVAIKAATIWFLDGLFNAVPLLELDGYYMLVDWLEMPMLRARSFQFVRQELWRKLRQHTPWTHEQRVFGLFGVLAAVFSGLMLLLTVWAWRVRGANIVAELWNLPAWYGKPLVVLFLLIFVGPLVLGVFSLLSAAVGWLVRQASWRLQEERLRQRAQPLLDALPYLVHLAPSERTALADHLRTRRANTGAVLVRQGEPPDGFYFIRSGIAEVERAAPDGAVRSVATLGAGDHFGEAAFLTGEPRNATVRARTPLTYAYLDGGHFRRWLQEDMAGRDDVLNRLVNHAELEHLALFSSLSPMERDQMLESIRVEQFAAGDMVFRQGDPGDRVYFVVRGRFEILVTDDDDAGQEAPERVLAEVGPGEYFGEIALLQDVPRTASVRAAEASRCYTLSRDQFIHLLEIAPTSRATLNRLTTERMQASHFGAGGRRLTRLYGRGRAATGDYGRAPASSARNRSAGRSTRSAGLTARLR